MSFSAALGFHGQTVVSCGICRPFGAFAVHTETGATAPLTDRNVVLHTLLITLRNKSQGIDVDPTLIVREHLGDRYIKVGSLPVDNIGLCQMQHVLPHIIV